MPGQERGSDAATDRLVRPYSLAGGRTSTTYSALDIATQVIQSRKFYDRAGLEPEHDAIIELCEQPRAVAEVASAMDMPLLPAKILLEDLIDCGALEAGSRVQDTSPANLELMEKILKHLRQL